MAPTRLIRTGLLALSVLVAAPVTHAFARPGPDGFADLAERLLPGVVNIASTQIIKGDSNQGPDVPSFPPGSPMEKFFHDFMERNRRPNGQGGSQGGSPAPQESRKSQSLGSGFIIDPAGYIVTNNHVIEGADEIKVILQDNTTLTATLVGRDEKVDVALLKVTTDKPLPAVAFGDSDKERVGDWVMAIGNPFGLGGTVTAGIVSARGRDIRQGAYDDFLQTDAPINQGNSGGPLFNMDGEVIGINTAIYSRSGGSIGLGFSIPSNQARAVVDQLRSFGHSRRGWLGVKIQEVTPDIAESVGLHDPTGAMIASTDDKGPAAAAKMQGGDIVLKFNNVDVKEMRNLPRLVAETAIGKQVPVVVWRDGKERTLQVTVGELPDDVKPVLASATPDKPILAKPVELAGIGLKIAPITDESRDKFQLPADQKGVLITDVAPNSSASDKGLKPGDVIVEVQQEEVKTPADVTDRVEKSRKASRRSVLMLVQTGDGLHWVPLTLAAPKQGG
jgi:serine protease Do